MTTVHGSPAMEALPKQRLHKLVDELPEGEIQAAERCLESLCNHRDPVLDAIRSAPIDDEPLTDEDLRAIEEGEREIAAGGGIPHDGIRRKYGL